jgi:hypothetical protein
MLVLLLIFSRLTYTRLAPFVPLGTFLLVPIVLMASAFGDFAITRVLSSRPLVAIGRVSYSIYLWQQLATYTFDGVGGFFLCLFAAPLRQLRLRFIRVFRGTANCNWPRAFVAVSEERLGLRFQLISLP